MRLKDKAITAYTDKHPNEVIDIGTIAIIADLVMELVSMFRECRQTPEQATNIMRRPTLVQKIALNSKISQKVGFFNFKLKNELKDALISAGSEATVDDVKEAYEKISS